MKLFLTILCLIFFICPVFADYFLSDVNAVYSERLGLMKMYSKATGEIIDYISYQEYSDWVDANNQQIEAANRFNETEERRFLEYSVRQMTLENIDSNLEKIAETLDK